MKAPPQQHHSSAWACRALAKSQVPWPFRVGRDQGWSGFHIGLRPRGGGRNQGKEPEESVATSPGAGLTAPVLFGGVEVNVEKGVHTECADPFSLRCSREGLRWARGRGGDDEVGVDVDEAV